MPELKPIIFSARRRPRLLAPAARPLAPSFQSCHPACGASRRKPPQAVARALIRALRARVAQPVTVNNVEILRVMNTAILPVRYDEQFYKNVIKNAKLAQFGAHSACARARPTRRGCALCSRGGRETTRPAVPQGSRLAVRRA